LPYLSEAEKADILDEALEIVSGIRDAEDRVKLFTLLLPYLPERPKIDILNEGVAVVCEIVENDDSALGVHNYTCVRLIVGLAPYLLPDQQIDVLEIIYNLKTTPKAQVEGWVALIPHLPVERRADIAVFVPLMKDELTRSALVLGLMPHLPDELRAKVVDAAQSIEDNLLRVQTVAGIAEYIPEGLKKEALTKTLGTLKGIEAYEQGGIFETLAPHWPDELWPEVLSVFEAADELLMWLKN
jgi:uncharacterized protein YeeX (DUF496 family)